MQGLEFFSKQGPIYESPLGGEKIPSYYERPSISFHKVEMLPMHPWGGRESVAPPSSNYPIA